MEVEFDKLCNLQCSRSKHYARDVLVNIDETEGSKMVYLVILVQPLLDEYFVILGVSTNGIRVYHYARLIRGSIL